MNGCSYPFFFFYVFPYIEPVDDCVLLCNTFISTEDYGVFHIYFNMNRTVLRECHPDSQLMFFRITWNLEGPFKRRAAAIQVGGGGAITAMSVTGITQKGRVTKTSELEGVCKQAVMAYIVGNVCSVTCT